jgi:hypothetical protein
MKRTQERVVKMWADAAHSGWMRIIMCVGSVVYGAFFSYASDVVQYWSLEEDSGATAINSVAGGNDGTLVNFSGGGWDTNTPAALASSTGSLDFDTASSQYVNGGHIGVSSTGLNKGATVSVWLKPKSLIQDMRLWGQLNHNTSTPHPLGAISLGSTVNGWVLQGFYPPGDRWLPIMPYNAYVTNVWQHFCFVWTEDQLVTYQNGNPVGGMDHAFEFDRDTGTAMEFGIGAKYLNNYGKSYDGKMDDLAVWDENLTAEQVRQLASGVSPLTIAARSDLTAPPKPLAEYRMDGNALDAGGNYPGTVLGGATFTNGVENTPFSYAGNLALQLHGNDDIGSVSIADSAALRPGTSAWTMSLWFKTSITNQNGTLIAKRKGASPYTQMALMMAGAGTGNSGPGQKIHTFVIGTEAERWEVTSSREYADGEWHHLALVRSTGDWSPVLYVDGAATAIFINKDAGTRPHDVNCTDPWRIGDLGTPGYYFEGLIDEVAMWDTALSSEEIAWLAQNSLSQIEPVMPEHPLAEYRMDGNAKDTRGRHPGSVAGDAAFVNGAGDTPFSYAGNAALQLDGSGDSMSIPDDAELRPGTSAWTLSLWFKTSNASQYGPLIANRKNASPYTQMQLLMGGAISGTPGNGEQIHTFVIGTQTSVDRWEVTSRSGYGDDEWHHLAFVRTSGDTSPVLYVDGAVTLVDVNMDAGTRPHDINCTVPWLIGTEGSAYFEGLIDEVAMWNVALPSEQIAWLAQNSLAAIPWDGTIILIK